MKRIIISIACLCLLITAQGQLTPEQQTIKKAFFGFLKFYQKNEVKFNSFHLYKGVGKENNPPYHIQWKEVDRYFAWLRSTVPYVGEAYIKAERRSFQFSDSCFKADPQDELPAGFDYDRWAGGQESIQYTIKWYTAPKNEYTVTINGDKAALLIGAELWKGAETKDRIWRRVPFVKEKGKWKMADNIGAVEEEDTPVND
jgi:hypothetical protein